MHKVLIKSKKNISGIRVIKLGVLVVFILMGTLFCKGQQDPMYTQYIFNLQTINPGYAGSWQNPGFVALSRIQWINFAGHPSTQTFSFQAPLNSLKVGVGLNIVVDKVGYEKRVTVNGDYSYKIKLSPLASLRFGLKGGFTNYSNNLIAYVQYPDNQTDMAFQSNIDNKLLPNLGVGLYLLHEKYYLSLSMPRILNNRISNGPDYYLNLESGQVYFGGGYVAPIFDNLKFKPTFMSYLVKGAPFQYDLSGNFLIAEKFQIGAMYRSGGAFGALAQVILGRGLRLGYAFDMSNHNSQYRHNGVHELMLSYEFINSNRRIISPRNF